MGGIARRSLDAQTLSGVAVSTTPITEVRQTASNKPTADGVYVFNVVPGDSLPSGVALGDIARLQGGTWSVVTPFASAPPSIQSGTGLNTLAWVKDGAMWVQQGTSSLEIKSVMQVAANKPTNDGLHIFSVTPSDGMPSGIGAAVGDILQLSGGTWSLYQKFAAAPPTIRVGGGNGQATWVRSAAGRWDRMDAVGATMKLFANSDNFQTMGNQSVDIINLSSAASFNNTTLFTANGDGGIKVNQQCVVLINANLTMDSGTAVSGSVPEGRRTLILTAGSTTIGSATCYLAKSQTDFAGMTFSTVHVCAKDDIIYLKGWHNWGASVNIKCRVAYGFGCDLSVTILRLGDKT